MAKVSVEKAKIYHPKKAVVKPISSSKHKES